MVEITIENLNMPKLEPEQDKPINVSVIVNTQVGDTLQQKAINPLMME
jgi:hypothetical protein